MTTYRDALNILLSVCDGAVELDDRGFNAVDAPLARSLSQFSVWSSKQQNLVKSILYKYKNQLRNYNISYEDLKCEITKDDLIKQHAETLKKMSEQNPILDFKNGKFTFKISFDKKDIAKNIARHYWDNENKYWIYHAETGGVVEAMHELIINRKDLNIIVKPAARDYINNYFDKKSKFDLSVKRVEQIKESELPDIPVPLKTKPFEHQKRAYMIGTELDAAAFLMEMGTGKTLSAISVAGKRYLDGKISKLLVMAPLSILHVWRQEFEIHADFPCNIIILNDTQMAKKREKILKCDKSNVLNILVVSYESAWRMANNLMDWKPDMVILDESQRIKNKNAKRSGFVHDIGDIVKYKLILSGTPVSQSPLDLFSQYRFLNKDIYGKSFYNFRNKYCMMGGYQNKQIVGYKDLEDLISKAHSIAYRVTKEEALDLPEFVDETLYFDLKDSLKSYRDMEKEMKVVIGDGNCTVNDLLPQMIRLSQITGGFLPISDESGKIVSVQQIGSEKLDLLKTIIEDYPKHKKLVIFCRFLPEIEAIHKMITDMGITCSVITGEVKGDEREQINTAFQTNDDPKIIVLQIRVGGLGITLTRADTMIFYSNTFSYSEYEQARARIHRSGQKNNCTYIQLVANKTIDEDIVKALKEKKGVADIVVDRCGGVV